MALDKLDLSPSLDHPSFGNSPVYHRIGEFSGTERSTSELYVRVGFILIFAGLGLATSMLATAATIVAIG